VAAAGELAVPGARLRPAADQLAPSSSGWTTRFSEETCIS
jgi:hypothetical protein